MKVFKFGGASVNSTSAVRNMAAIVKKNLGHPLMIVVSAMGKTTNRLEQLVPGVRPKAEHPAPAGQNSAGLPPSDYPRTLRRPQPSGLSRLRPTFRPIVATMCPKAHQLQLRLRPDGVLRRAHLHHHHQPLPQLHRAGEPVGGRAPNHLHQPELPRGHRRL